MDWDKINKKKAIQHHGSSALISRAGTALGATGRYAFKARSQQWYEDTYEQRSLKRTLASAKVSLAKVSFERKG